MKFTGKRLLFIDIETSGLPLARKSVRRFDKYVSPDINIAYNKSRLLSLSVYADGEWLHHSDVTIRKDWYRSTSDLTDDSYTTNKDKYRDKPKHPIATLLSESLVYFKECDYVVGHNILFDLHIIANEFHRIGHDGYAVITAIINESRYFCTLMMAKMLGVDDKDIDLQSMVKRFTNASGFAFHDSRDDVMATRLVFESGITKLNSIPAIIDDITDRIYPPTEFGDCSGCHIVMKVNRMVFHYYVDILKPLAYRYYVSGKLELYISKEQLAKLNTHLLMTLDGQCHISNGTNRASNTRYIIDTIVYNCDICNSQMVGMSICDGCISDSVFRFAEQFETIKADFSDTITIAELKARLKDIKGSSRRNGVLAIETQKKGRSLVMPLNKVEFYIEKRLYEHFSVKAGSTKL